MKQHTTNKILLTFVIAIILACSLAVLNGCSSNNTATQNQNQSQNKAEQVNTRELTPVIIATRDTTKSGSMQDTILIYENGMVDRVISFDRSTKDAVNANDYNEIKVQLQLVDRFPTQITISDEDMKTIQNALTSKTDSMQAIPVDEEYDWFVFALSDNAIIKVITDNNESNLSEDNVNTIKDILKEYWQQS